MRCDAAREQFGSECLDSDLDPILKFGPDGNVVESFGGGCIWPHGLEIDPDGNVWVTDAVASRRTPEGKRGHQVIKFSPQGEVLMILGTPGMAGNDKKHFTFRKYDGESRALLDEAVWDTSKNPEKQQPRFIQNGRIGLRQMSTKQCVYRNFTVRPL